MCRGRDGRRLLERIETFEDLGAEANEAGPAEGGADRVRDVLLETPVTSLTILR